MQNGDRPGFIPLREPPHRLQGGGVQGRLFAIGRDEDVGGDRDHDHPSIRSSRRSRSVTPTPGSVRPGWVFHCRA
jgi:hypothetical protein